jgi:hypothetical protein
MYVYKLKCGFNMVVNAYFNIKDRFFLIIKIKLNIHFPIYLKFGTL